MNQQINAEDMTQFEQTNDAFSRSLFQVIKTPSPAAQIRQAMHESGLISRFDLSIFDKIPVVGSFFGLVRAVGTTSLNFQSWFLEQKLLRFIEGLQDIPLGEREAFVNQFESDESSRQDVTNTLLVILDRYDHLEKPYLLVKVLKGRARGEIDEETFWRLPLEIDRAFMQDIRHLINYFSTDSTRSVPWERLVSCGLGSLIYDVGETPGEEFVIGGLYGPSNDARILAKLVLEAEFVDKHMRY